MAKTPKPEDKKQGPPAYMVSFADMMTLILTFFILLVSMAKEQKPGLMARGLGSFVVAVQSHGLNGLLDGKEKQAVYDHVRRKFNLPPEPDGERRDTHVDASNLELLRTTALKALQPHKAITQPMIAVFESGSSTLTDTAKKYLRRIAPTLVPSSGQLLSLEGHADSRFDDYAGDIRFLAYERANAVRDYLVSEHGLKASRIETRAWFEELPNSSDSIRSVDARLITPSN